MKYLNRISEKLKEADFFLQRMALTEREVDELNYYFSAFTSAARSVTFVLQYVGSALSWFEEWYAEVQARQRGDKAAKYLLEARNEALKTGAQPIAYGEVVRFPNGEEKLVNFFSYLGSEPPTEVPSMDVLYTCTHQMQNLVQIVGEFFDRFEEEVWDASKEKREVLAHLTHFRPVIHGGAAPPELWQQLVDFIGGANFQPPRPSEAIRALRERYGS